MIGLISNPLTYLLAIIAGTVLSAFLVTALKSRNTTSDTQIEESLTHAAIA